MFSRLRISRVCSTLLAFLGVWFYPCSHQRPSTPVNKYGYESIPVRSPVCLFRFSTRVSGFRVFRENCADSDGPDVLVTVEAPRVAYGTETRIIMTVCRGLVGILVM